MEFLEILKVIFLGIVEGITEWLPISSTGHMILVNEFIELDVSPDFMNVFLVVIQLGAILAVVVLFFKKLWPFSMKKEDHYIKKDIWVLWFKIFVASIPAGVLGILFDDILDEALGSYVVVAVALIVYGILFILIEKRNAGIRPKVSSLGALSYRTAFIIGICQALAMIPGTSRSGTTILGAMLLGTSRLVAAEFTFYLAVPAMFGGSFVKLVKHGFDFTGTEIGILMLGMVVAFIISVFVIKFLLRYIRKHDFSAFGWYRIALGVIVLAYFALV